MDAFFFFSNMLLNFSLWKTKFIFIILSGESGRYRQFSFFHISAEALKNLPSYPTYSKSFSPPPPTGVSVRKVK
jgi:hypothetical protein